MVIGEAKGTPRQLGPRSTIFFSTRTNYLEHKVRKLGWGRKEWTTKQRFSLNFLKISFHFIFLFVKCAVTINLRLFLSFRALITPKPKTTSSSTERTYEFRLISSSVFIFIIITSVFSFFLVSAPGLFIFVACALSRMKKANWYIAVACGWAPALQEEPTWRRHWPGHLPGGSALQMLGFVRLLPAAAAHSLGCPSCVVGRRTLDIAFPLALGLLVTIWVGRTQTVQHCCCLRHAAGHCIF